MSFLELRRFKHSDIHLIAKELIIYTSNSMACPEQNFHQLKDLMIFLEVLILFELFIIQVNFVHY